MKTTRLIIRSLVRFIVFTQGTDKTIHFISCGRPYTFLATHTHVVYIIHREKLDGQDLASFSLLLLLLLRIYIVLSARRFI